MQRYSHVASSIGHRQPTFSSHFCFVEWIPFCLVLWQFSQKVLASFRQRDEGTAKYSYKWTERKWRSGGGFSSIGNGNGFGRIGFGKVRKSWPRSQASFLQKSKYFQRKLCRICSIINVINSLCNLSCDEMNTHYLFGHLDDFSFLIAW